MVPVARVTTGPPASDAPSICPGVATELEARKFDGPNSLRFSRCFPDLSHFRSHSHCHSFLYLESPPDLECPDSHSSFHHGRRCPDRPQQLCVRQTGGLTRSVRSSRSALRDRRHFGPRSSIRSVLHSWCDRKRRYRREV